MGKRRLVEAKYESGLLLPERGKSCSTAAIPGLSKRFQTFEAFAVADLENVYTSECLDDATKLYATTLASAVLINDGSGRFEFKPLPRLAQISPSNGVLLTHLDGDGHIDMVLAQNDFSPQRETGRMDGGVSLVLRGDGLGNFTECWPSESNVSISADAQCVLATDTNGDRRPDLIFGVNDQPWATFESADQGKSIAIRLVGPTGNPTATGARVELILSNEQKLVQEAYSGVGYLTQGSGDLFFAHGSSSVKTIRVRWPDGTMTDTAPGETDMILIRHKDHESVQNVRQQ